MIMCFGTWNRRICQGTCGSKTLHISLTSRWNAIRSILVLSEKNWKSMWKTHNVGMRHAASKLCVAANWTSCVDFLQCTIHSCSRTCTLLTSDCFTYIISIVFFLCLCHRHIIKWCVALSLSLSRTCSPLNSWSV